MRLLIFTQKVDKNDSVLGFFHTWIREIAKKSERVIVICLEKGNLDLPENVTVYSLGKEENVSKIKYLKNLYRYLSLIDGQYDKVFVHMNQEYVLLARLYWRLKQIPIYFWRNHPTGNITTYISVLLATKVFYTSSQSFTSRFKKAVIMPVGVDTDVFKQNGVTVRKKYSVCMIGRISPIKHIEKALEAINNLVSSDTQVTLSIVGGVAPKDIEYYNMLQKYVEDNKLSTYVYFIDAVSPDKLPEIYNGHEVCLNLTESGSFDKTIVEASSCGAIPLVSNDSLKDLLPEVCITSDYVERITSSIKRILNATEQIKIQKDLENFVKSQSLYSLIKKLFIEIS